MYGSYKRESKCHFGNEKHNIRNNLKEAQMA